MKGLDNMIKNGNSFINTLYDKFETLKNQKLANKWDFLDNNNNEFLNKLEESLDNDSIMTDEWQ